MLRIAAGLKRVGYPAISGGLHLFEVFNSRTLAPPFRRRQRGFQWPLQAIRGPTERRGWTKPLRGRYVEPPYRNL